MAELEGWCSIQKELTVSLISCALGECLSHTESSNPPAKDPPGSGPRGGIATTTGLESKGWAARTTTTSFLTSHCMTRWMAHTLLAQARRSDHSLKNKISPNAAGSSLEDSNALGTQRVALSSRQPPKPHREVARCFAQTTLRSFIPTQACVRAPALPTIAHSLPYTKRLLCRIPRSVCSQCLSISTNLRILTTDACQEWRISRSVGRSDQQTYGSTDRRFTCAPQTPCRSSTDRSSCRTAPCSPRARASTSRCNRGET